jgi:uncharacterized coiled-coil DUF342 family protein
MSEPQDHDFCRHGVRDAFDTGACPKCARHFRAMRKAIREQPATIRRERDSFSDALHELRGELCRLTAELEALKAENDELRKGKPT